MKISIDPMPVLRERAAARVADHYNHLAAQNLHTDQLHHARLATGNTKERHPVEHRETERVALIAEIAAAPTPVALNAVMRAANLA